MYVGPSQYTFILLYWLSRIFVSLTLFARVQVIFFLVLSQG